jgi:hypothetical protein
VNARSRLITPAATQGSGDSGIDVRADEAVAQVKTHAEPVQSPDIQLLRGQRTAWSTRCSIRSAGSFVGRWPKGTGSTLRSSMLCMEFRSLKTRSSHNSSRMLSKLACNGQFRPRVRSGLPKGD